MVSRKKGVINLKNRKKFCHLCGSEVPFGEVCFSLGARAVCCDCADGITTDDLYLVTGARDARALLAALGFERGVLF